MKRIPSSVFLICCVAIITTGCMGLLNLGGAEVGLPYKREFEIPAVDLMPLGLDIASDVSILAGGSGFTCAPDPPSSIGELLCGETYVDAGWSLGYTWAAMDGEAYETTLFVENRYTERCERTTNEIPETWSTYQSDQQNNVSLISVYGYQGPIYFRPGFGSTDCKRGHTYHSTSEHWAPFGFGYITSGATASG